MTVRIVRLEPEATCAETDSLRARCRELRRRVFCTEQGIPEEVEFDAADRESVYLAALSGERVVGTLRLLELRNDLRLGRMAVPPERRREGIGLRLVDAARVLAAVRGKRRIVLHAQATSVPFYERSGFQGGGRQFVEAGIPHVAMALRLPRAPDQSFSV